MLIILTDRWQGLSYLIGLHVNMSRYKSYDTHAADESSKHAIWQKSCCASVVISVFSWILEGNASKEEKKSLSIFVLNSKTEEVHKIVSQGVGF